jgi:hypothetical protein
VILPLNGRMTNAAIADARFRLKLVPLIVVAALGFGMPIAGGMAAIYTARLLHWTIIPGANLPWLYLQHAYQFVVALIVIAIFKFWLVPADYGLHMPREKSYIWPAIAWGIFFGVLMTVVDYAPQLIAHTKPDAGYPLTPQNVWGWLFFEGVYVGPTEEIPFRALLVTYLAVTMPGKLRLGRFEMNWAGVLVAVIFALLHASNFSVRAWPEALGQQFYAFALGVLYAYWLEKSKSIVAPIIGHNLSDVVETTIMMAWIAFL